jgi:hypothetical protein
VVKEKGGGTLCKAVIGKFGKECPSEIRPVADAGIIAKRGEDFLQCVAVIVGFELRMDVPHQKGIANGAHGSIKRLLV